MMPLAGLAGIPPGVGTVVVVAGKEGWAGELLAGELLAGVLLAEVVGAVVELVAAVVGLVAGEVRASLDETSTSEPSCSWIVPAGTEELTSIMTGPERYFIT